MFANSKKNAIILTMNILKKIMYYLLAIQEKVLRLRLNKTLTKSHKNKTSKTFLSSTERLTLNTKSEELKNTVKQNVLDIVKNCKNNPDKLLEYVKTTGTEVFKLDNADKILRVIGEGEGLVCELKGLKALYLNICLNKGLSLYCKPVFVMREGKIDPLYMLHHFYKWYSLKMNLSGFDYATQQNFKKYLKNVNDPNISALTMDEVMNLQEAVARDQEATTFVLEYAKSTAGANNVKKKMQNEGGANI